MVSPCCSEAPSAPAANVLDALGCTSTLVFCTSSSASTGPEDEPVDEDEPLGVVRVVVVVVVVVVLVVSSLFSAAVALVALSANTTAPSERMATKRWTSGDLFGMFRPSRRRWGAARNAVSGKRDYLTVRVG